MKITIRNISACVLFIALASQSQAQTKVSYSEARKLYNQFDKTLSAVGLWGKKNQSERTQLLQAAMRHREQVEKSLGVSSQCATAANMHVEFVSNLNAIGRAKDGTGTPTHFESFMALASAEQFGNHRAACYDQVEALDTPKKP
jgi:hypothetical protein